MALQNYSQNAWGKLRTAVTGLKFSLSIYMQLTGFNISTIVGLQNTLVGQSEPFTV